VVDGDLLQVLDPEQSGLPAEHVGGSIAGHDVGQPGREVHPCVLALEVVRCQGADWASRYPAGGSLTVGVQLAGDGNAPVAPVLTTG
jgi:hypothetical protein